ncbi:MAG: HAD-IIIC family phosphatase [Chlamydiales bacterium]|nr:HAD-IIIC family phosphatase [Chlamydiales bacterium]NCF71739.1 HAD-IIIC family phosphatase [Chlamydiales bacterium]
MLAILSNINIEPISNLIDVEYFGSYDQIISELENPSTFTHSPQCSTVWIHIDAQEFIKDLYYNKEGKQSVLELFDLTLQSIKAFLQKHSEKRLIVSTLCLPAMNYHTFIDAAEASSSFALEFELNSRLHELKNSCANLHLLPTNLVFHQLGFKECFASKYWYLGRIKYSNSAFKALAKQYKNLETALKNQYKKVLVLDLDNTLWGGVLGELGPQGISLGSELIAKAYQDFQKAVKSLKDLGVILAICSKNNEADAKEAFDTNPNMVLAWDDFASLKVNWQAKHENIQEMANELSLGLDAFVFIDDNPVERDLVKSMLPEVTVPDFPKDPCQLPSWFLDSVVYPHFPKVHLTREDRLKNTLYKQKSARSNFAKTKSLKDFLTALEINLTIYKDPAELMSRLSQLTQKTNQFNLTLKRYEEFEIENMIHDPNYLLLAADYHDKFGGEGVIALIILRISGKTAYIENFLLSCRVIGREVEKALFSQALKLMSSDNIESIRGHYTAGKRNQLIENLLKELGLEEIEKHHYKQSIKALLENSYTYPIKIKQVESISAN